MSTIHGLSAAQFSYDMQTPPRVENKQLERAEQVRDAFMATVRRVDSDLAEWTPRCIEDSRFDGLKLALSIEVQVHVSEDEAFALKDLAGKLRLLAQCLESRIQGGN